MSWQVTLQRGDGERVVVDLDDLSPDSFVAIADQGPEGTNFREVFQRPFDRQWAYQLVCLCAEKAEMEPPPSPSNWGGVRRLTDLFGVGPDPYVEPDREGAGTWVVTFGSGEVVNFDDLSDDAFDEIAVLDGRATAYGVSLWPRDHPDRLLRVLTMCAEYVGVPAPEKPSTMGEVKSLWRLFSWSEDTPENQSMADGFPMTPGEQEAGSTSTSPGVTDGLPTSSDGNEDTTS